ncbi:ABC transporter substrate-binding protein [Desulfovibrio sp. X2]|uniref:ABC transporter substrate-binding protein n=1 Tax=Desulfovibrio sp. X2 TaxID=941449 RepID=UPI001F32BF6B|nr:ABC transporter substrate-binding protein [Desulfovibrio sp. X2]
MRFASVGWTGVTVKTELAVKILQTLGYQASNTMLSVPIVYTALSTNEADVFLGNWMPSMKSIAEKYFADGSVVKYVANMTGAKYTLAVPSYEAKAGLKSFADIARFADKLDHKIYGIEEGNDGNEIIEQMIKRNDFGLGNFQLIPSSEAGMLAQVMSYAKEGKWIVFLGWAPHYMNTLIDMTYLTGSTDKTFGPNDGTATVYTNLRKGFAAQRPNVAVFLKHLVFPVSMMNEIMTAMHDNEDLKPLEAGLSWLKKHPKTYAGWLEGVKTVDGEPALPVFESFMASVK